MSLYSEFATDPRLEADGFELVYNGRGGKPLFAVKLRRPGGANKQYDAIRERITAPYRRARNLNHETNMKIAREIFVEACIVPNSWFTFVEKPELNEKGEREYERQPGIQDHLPDGSNPIVPASVANLNRILAAQPQLFELLAVEANAMDNYRVEALEDEAKNS